MNVWQRGGSRLRRQIVRWLRNAHDMERMRRHEDTRVAALARAVDATIAGEFAAEERERIAAIEALRARLEASRETLTLDAPGARSASCGGSPGERATRHVTLGRTTRRNSKRLPWCELLFRTLRELRPERAIELGTCVGISASFQAAALELNGAGHLVTLEGQEAFARIARANLEELGLAGRATLVVGRFDETLPRVLAEPLGPVDFVFLDGNHTEEATWRYYEALLPAMRERGVLVFDDIDWSAGMRRVWTRVREDSRLGAAIDLTKIGVGVVGTSTGDVVPDQFTVAI